MLSYGLKKTKWVSLSFWVREVNRGFSNGDQLQAFGSTLTRAHMLSLVYQFCLGSVRLWNDWVFVWVFFFFKLSFIINYLPPLSLQS